MAQASHAVMTEFDQAREAPTFSIRVKNDWYLPHIFIVKMNYWLPDVFRSQDFNSVTLAVDYQRILSL